MMRWLKCKDASLLASREYDAPLNWAERASLRLHYVICTSCRNFRNNLKILRLAMKQYLDRGADK
jgi:hypothetical protein